MTGADPLPGSAPAVVAAPAPGPGPGFWSGASSAVLDDDGSVVVAYRVHNGHDGLDWRWHGTRPACRTRATSSGPSSSPPRHDREDARDGLSKSARWLRLSL